MQSYFLKDQWAFPSILCPDSLRGECERHSRQFMKHWGKFLQVFLISLVAGEAIQINWILNNCDGVFSLHSEIPACQDNLLRLAIGWLLAPIILAFSTGAVVFLFLPVMKETGLQKNIWIKIMPAYQSFYILALLPLGIVNDVVVILLLSALFVLFLIFWALPRESKILFRKWNHFLKQSSSRFPQIIYSKKDFFKNDTIALTILLCFFSGPLLQNFTSFHYHQVDDALVMGLVSTQKLSLFYWGQSRFGMIFPALASLIQNTNANFYFLTMLQVTAFFLGAYFLFYLAVGRYALLPFALFSLMMSVLWGDFDWSYYLIPVPILTSLFFFSLSAILIRNKIILGLANSWFIYIFIFSLCGLLINPAGILLIVGVFLAYKSFSLRNLEIFHAYEKINVTSIENKRKMNWTACAITFFPPFLFSFLFSNSGGFVSFSEWLQGIKILIQNLVFQLHGGWLSIFIFFIFACILMLLLLCSPLAKVSKKSLKRKMYVFLLPGLLTLLLMSTLKHVEDNTYHPRYIVFLWWLTAIFVFAHLGYLFRKLSQKYVRLSGYVIFLLALFILADKFSLQSKPTSPRDQINQRYAPPISEIRKNKCQLIVGSYKFVWPAVWLMNAHYPQGPEYYGITRRSKNTKELWLKAIHGGAILCSQKHELLTNYVENGNILHENIFVKAHLSKIKLKKVGESENMVFFKEINEL